MNDIDDITAGEQWTNERGSMNSIADGYDAAEFAARFARSEAARVIDKALKEAATDSGKVARLVRLSERLKAEAATS